MKQIVKVRQIIINDKILKLPASMKGKGHYLPILNKTVEQLDAMVITHSKVLVIRFDLHLYESTRDNLQVSKFIRRYRKWAEAKGFGGVRYIWCREQNFGEAQHYHCALFLNGHKTRHPHPHLVEIERIWKERDIGSVYTPKHCYYVLKRGDFVTYQRVFDRLSYLAKVATKNARSKTTNSYSTSRL